MNPPPGWVETNKPWQLGNYQIGDKVYAPPASTTTTGGAPGGDPATAPAYTGGMQPYNITKANANITAGLNGELPQDVVDQLRTHAAEFGVSSGLSGSDFSGYNGLKNLGLTSLQRQDDATKMTLPFIMSPADIDRRRQLDQSTIYQNKAIQDADIARAQKQQQAASDAWERGRSGGLADLLPGWNKSGGASPTLAPMGVNSGGGGGSAPPAHSVANDIISRNLPGLGDLLGGYGNSDPHGTGSYAPLQVGIGDNGDWTADNDWVME